VKAAEYYKLCADQGEAVGQNNLRFCLMMGLGVAKDPVRAVEYFKLAMAQGQCFG
jgi:TPR repeat protein